MPHRSIKPQASYYLLKRKLVEWGLFALKTKNNAEEISSKQNERGSHSNEPLLKEGDGRQTSEKSTLHIKDPE
jgi:hypothetical protein